MRRIVPNLVSTIIPVHNRPKMVRSAVASVLAQDYRPIEIVIVDDGSTDSTLEVCNRLPTRYSESILVLSQGNLGPGPARELGRQDANGEFIQYLDSDDRLLPGKFTAQVNALRKNPDCGIAYGITRLVDYEGNVLTEPFKWTGDDRQYLFPGLLVDRWWCTHTPLYRRTVCDEIGPWSELRYSQDWEYDARAGALGIKLVNTNVLVSEHHTHGEKRQTGHGGWLTPTDQVRFFSTLYDCAARAGVIESVPEMRHFSRWVFSQARHCGSTGDVAPARELFRLALRAADSPDLKMRVTGALASVFGWKVVGRLGQLRDSLFRSPGPGTLKQSWMQEDR